jgi:hypothetical protein
MKAPKGRDERVRSNASGQEAIKNMKKLRRGEIICDGIISPLRGFES